MKKMFSLLVAFLFLFSSAAVADSMTFDDVFAPLDLDQLLEVNRYVQYYLFQKYAGSVDGAYVPAGIYTVGQDIPACVYRVEIKDKSQLVACGFLAINEESVFGFSSILNCDTPVIGRIDLSEGTTVTITNGDTLFYTYTGLFGR